MSNEILDRLRDHKKELALKIDREFAWSVLRDSYDSSKPDRFVAGVCVSSAEKNSNGNAFAARGVNVALPIPLLLEHQWMQPIGKVIAIEACGDQLLFKAMVSNCGRQLWVDDLWMSIVCKFVTGASVGPRNLAKYPPYDGTFSDWTIDEISITEKGADPGARIHRVWQRMPYVSLNRPSEALYWSSDRGRP